MGPYRLVLGKEGHLPIELEYRAYQAIKKLNFDFKKTARCEVAFECGRMLKYTKNTAPKFETFFQENCVLDGLDLAFCLTQKLNKALGGTTHWITRYQFLYYSFLYLFVFKVVSFRFTLRTIFSSGFGGSKKNSCAFCFHLYVYLCLEQLKLFSCM